MMAEEITVHMFCCYNYLDILHVGVLRESDLAWTELCADLPPAQESLGQV